MSLVYMAAEVGRGRRLSSGLEFLDANLQRLLCTLPQVPQTVGAGRFLGLKVGNGNNGA